MQVSEEIKFDPKVMVDRVDRRQTFHQAQLEHGDILVVQPSLSQVPSCSSCDFVQFAKCHLHPMRVFAAHRCNAAMYPFPWLCGPC